MKRLALDVEYTNYTKTFSPYSTDKLLTVAAFDGKKKYFWNIGHPDAPQDNLDLLIKFLNDPQIELEGANLKSDRLWLEVFFDSWNILESNKIKCASFDILNFAHSYCLIDRDKGERNSLEYLAYKFCNSEPYKHKIKVNALDKEPLVAVKEYNIHDCVETYNVATIFRTKYLDKKSKDEIARQFNAECTKVLINMEERGILVDKTQAYIVGKTIHDEIAEIQARINKIANREVYVESNTKDLPKLFYEEMKFPILMVSETTGNPSCDIDAINELRYDINMKNGYAKTAEGKKKLELLQAVQDYRKKTKLWSTYLKPLPQYLQHDGRVHTKYNVGKGYVDPALNKDKGAGSGRLSSEKPNLQNQPAIKLIRNMYVAKLKHMFIDADYSQLELVVLAAISRAAEMIKAIIEGKDIHTFTTAMLDHVTYEMVKEILDNEKHKDYDKWKRKRWFRKRAGFGIVYGIGPYHLTQLLKYEGIDITMGEAKMIIAEWLSLYPEVEKLRQETFQEAAKYGYVTSIFGHRLLTPHAKAQTDKQLIARNQRQAFNFKIQGAAAFICLIAMLLIDAKHPNTLLLQVHDSLLGEEKIEKITETAASYKKIMTVDSKIFMKDIFNVDFDVPLTVKVKESRKWTA